MRAPRDPVSRIRVLNQICLGLIRVGQVDRARELMDDLRDEMQRQHFPGGRLPSIRYYSFDVLANRLREAGNTAAALDLREAFLLTPVHPAMLATPLFWRQDLESLADEDSVRARRAGLEQRHREFFPEHDPICRAIATALEE